jgi:hypothetical protein
MKRFIIDFIKGTVFVTGSLIAIVVAFTGVLASMIYGVGAVGILETNGHMGLAWGIAFITLLIMLLEIYFIHRTLDWLQNTTWLD